jgi:NADPH2:quinone reductase
MTIDRMMRAAWYERTGPAEQVLTVGEVETPAPGAGQVLVRIAMSGVNPHDTKRRSGWIGGELPAARVIPHFDAAGTIAAVGAGVDAARTGERVWLFRAETLAAGRGTAAEFAVVPAANAIPLPDGVPFTAGASLGVPGLTAYLALSGDGPLADRTVLVQGGAGAVAGYAIQLARHRGARVLATVSSPEKAAVARAFGADAVIDYRREPVAEAVMRLTGGAGVDRIVEVDFGANIATDVAVIRPHGVIASYSSTRVREPVLPYYPLQFKAVTIRCVQGLLLTEAQRDGGVAELTRLMRSGMLRHPPAHVFPLERIAEAHTALESGRLIGKVLVQIGDDDRAR